MLVQNREVDASDSENAYPDCRLHLRQDLLHRSLSNLFGACLSMQEVHVEIESTPRSHGKLECPLFMDTTFGSKLDLVVDINYSVHRCNLPTDRPTMSSHIVLCF